MLWYSIRGFTHFQDVQWCKRILLISHQEISHHPGVDYVPMTTWTINVLFPSQSIQFVQYFIIDPPNWFFYLKHFSGVDQTRWSAPRHITDAEDPNVLVSMLTSTITPLSKALPWAKNPKNNQISQC